MSDKTDKKSSDSAVLSIRVQPRASKNGISRTENGGFRVRLTAPAVENAANEALVKFLAEALDVAKSRVAIVSGLTSREKRVRIEGITKTDAERVLNGRKE